MPKVPPCRAEGQPGLSDRNSSLRKGDFLLQVLNWAQESCCNSGVHQQSGSCSTTHCQEEGAPAFIHSALKTPGEEGAPQPWHKQQHLGHGQAEEGKSSQ